MLEVSQVLECKQLAGQGVPIREISRRLDISRNTVRRYLRGAEPGVYRQDEPRSRPASERVRPRVQALLEEEGKRETPRKQRLTAARIHRILVGEGLSASERTVRSVVHEVRHELRDHLQHAYLPLAYDPGKDGQVDFMESEVEDIHEGRVKSFVLIVRACFSRRTFRYASPNQTREALFEGLIRAFVFFGGVFTHLWFDNLTPAVRKVLKGRERELQRAFEAFQAHYGFKAEFCSPGKGNEKGGVENDVKWTRSEVFSPIPRVDGRQGVQEHLDAFATAELDRKIRGCDRTIGDLWEVEQEHLLPLPPRPFDAATTRTATVTNRSWVQTGRNFYSVPVNLVGSEVTLKLLAEEVVVLDRSGEIARHRRSYGQDKMTLHLEHYLPLLVRKHRGLDRAVPVRQWLEAAPACWVQLLEELRRCDGEIDGSKQFVEALQLTSHHGIEATTRAVEATLKAGTSSLPMIRYHLGRDEEAKRPEVVPITYAGPSVQSGSASIYEEVFCG
jgi:transposase